MWVGHASIAVDDRYTAHFTTFVFIGCIYVYPFLRVCHYIRSYLFKVYLGFFKFSMRVHQIHLFEIFIFVPSVAPVFTFSTSIYSFGIIFIFSEHFKKLLRDFNRHHSIDIWYKLRPSVYAILPQIYNRTSRFRALDQNTQRRSGP